MYYAYLSITYQAIITIDIVETLEKSWANDPLSNVWKNIDFAYENVYYI